VPNAKTPVAIAVDTSLADSLRILPDRSAPAPRIAAAKGDIMIVTDDLTLVFSLRHDLLRGGYGLTWTNNFWVALSYLNDRVFAGVVLDLRVESIEERFIPQFFEEYEGRSSSGAKVLLSAGPLGSGLRSQLQDQGHQVVPASSPARVVVKALQLPEHAEWNIRSAVDQ
jgi:hypothetical protein